MKKIFVFIVIIGVLFSGLQFFDITVDDLTAMYNDNGFKLLKKIPGEFTGILANINLRIGKLLGTKKDKESIARSDAGETHLEGKIKKIQDTPRAIEIRLHKGDNHDQIENPIQVASKAVFKIREKVVTFRSLKIGDIVGIILNEDGKAREITVYNRQK